MLLLLMIIALLRLHHLRQQSRKDKHEQVMRLLGLTTVTGQRFFDAIFESQNRSLFRDYFRMDQEAFGALFQACQSHIRSSLGSQREVLAVALNWLETAATCRSQEVLFDLAFSRCTSTVFMEFTQLYDPLGFPFFVFFAYLIVMAPGWRRHSSAVAFASVVSVAAVGRGLWLLSRPTTGSLRHLGHLDLLLRKH
ncbi:hypothetical protein F442_02090 [Phytophthora nicotianae P10297]|uniref:Uncharacterized protein n=3 Tax=Phytophthora nicotianae TaxID=4792 RepID=V9FUJ5_PHYNI|nr:hypothetical protein PPTG_19222 [Phytophthora nicotianae INRA-310]ETI30267.1 hypothetical protein F443_22612 [Phytophthora nicotianae P1569]ETI55175.1 hypothetical protein F443_02134 [Phytophthora nicotianae P1569]ETM98892.1 hypothetical protein PPTG_19222 [Phytophthora nicotianae INRA-310]ETP52978.1 hypothetical protein F442_02090 [Phytophthora nicotianae P10297]